jgi:hypothetical protein
MSTFDVGAVPQRFEHSVGEPGAEQVVDGGHAEDVVDAEDGVLVRDAGDEVVERDRALKVFAEGLLEHDPAPRGQAGGTEARDRGGKRRWREGQVGGDGPGVGVDHGGDAAWVGEIDRPVAQRAHERRAGLSGDVGGMAVEPVAGECSEAVVVKSLASGAHDVEAGG